MVSRHMSTSSSHIAAHMCKDLNRPHLQLCSIMSKRDTVLLNVCAQAPHVKITDIPLIIIMMYHRRWYITMARQLQCLQPMCSSCVLVNVRCVTYIRLHAPCLSQTLIDAWP